MTDAQIALYAAVRVAVPGSWRVRLVSPYTAHTLPEAPAVLIVECWRERNHRLDQLRHAVPSHLLEDPRTREGTIGIDVRQIVDDLQNHDSLPLGGLGLR